MAANYPSLGNEMVIWKYPLELVEEQLLAIPNHAEILSVGNDPQGQLCVWVLTCPTWAISDHRKIYIVGTGHPVPKGLAERHFVGTVRQGMFMWHVFQANT